MQKDRINKELLPKHIAIVMDGNGRWAKQQGYDRIFGHTSGISTVRSITEASVEIGIQYLTLYTFSTENWSRPQEEIHGIMGLLVESIEKERETFIKNNVRLLAIGDLMRLPEDVRIKLQNCIADTSKHSGLTLVLALSYSSRWEITNALKNIVSDIEKGIINTESIDESLISKYLTTSNIPDPDIVIRTGGDIRISNFLLWQAAYSEFFFTTKYWPEFSKEDYYDIIYQFQHRERRFGKTSEQIKTVTKQ